MSSVCSIRLLLLMLVGVLRHLPSFVSVAVLICPELEDIRVGRCFAFGVMCRSKDGSGGVWSLLVCVPLRLYGLRPLAP
jgi:hypothetical protein